MFETGILIWHILASVGVSSNSPLPLLKSDCNGNGQERQCFSVINASESTIHSSMYVTQCIVLHPLTQKLMTMVLGAVKRIGNNRTQMVY